jgi:excisionase family DNA binding protein
MDKKFLKTNEAARYLGVSRSSLTNWVKQGLLGSGVTPGGHYRFTLDELNSFAERRGLNLPGEPLEKTSAKILIIDDDEGFREFLKDALEDFSGCFIKETVDGMQGALLAGSWEPDLIILDIRMPNMNGVEFLRLLRQDSKTSRISVIVASAYLSAEVRKEVEDLDADIILEKPVRLAKLVASVQSLLNLKLT